MLKADIVMMDGTVLDQVMLFKDRNMGDSQILTKKEANKLLDFENDKTIYFGGKYVQGWLITKQIMEYQLFDDTDSVEAKIKEFVRLNNTIYDTNDTAEYIIEYRERLLELLR